MEELSLATLEGCVVVEIEPAVRDQEPGSRLDHLGAEVGTEQEPDHLAHLRPVGEGGDHLAAPDELGNRAGLRREREDIRRSPRRSSRQETLCEPSLQVEPAAWMLGDHRELRIPERAGERPFGSPIDGARGEHELPEAFERSPDRRAVEGQLVERPLIVSLPAGLREQQVLDPVGTGPPIRVPGFKA